MSNTSTDRMSDTNSNSDSNSDPKTGSTNSSPSSSPSSASSSSSSSSTANAVAERQIILRKRKSGVAFLLFDAPGKVNLLTPSIINDFEDLLEKAEQDPEITAIVCLSAKHDSFILGADLHEIIKFTSESEALALSERGQRLFNKLAEFPKPTVAGIHGLCLGGGLELALCCDRRIATSDKITELGLPEVKLGFVPGLGGTQRLPRVVSIKGALEIIISAEPVTAERALELGLVQELVLPENLLDSAEKLALELTAVPKHDRAVVPPQMEPEKQAKLFAMTERSLRIKTKGKYEAPQKAIDVIKVGLTDGLEAGLAAEAQAFAKLAIGEVSRNLVFLFFTTEFYRQTAKALALKSGLTGRPNLPTIAIIGGGFMGSQLAATAALKGCRVLLRSAHKDRQHLAFEKATSLAKSLTDDNQPPPQIISVEDDAMLSQADIVVEACAEDLESKKAIFVQLARHLNPTALLATNTSSLSITELSEPVQDKKNFLGLHFFHPIDRMPLVELIAHSATEKQAIAKATFLAQLLGKIPLTVKDSPAFLVNRLLAVYVIGAAQLAESGEPVNWLEEAALDFGMPMGPFTLMDEVGLDVADLVANVLHSAFGERLVPPKSLALGVKCGMVGKKTGEGIYMFDQSGKKLDFNPKLKTEVKLTLADEKVESGKAKELAEAMLLPMVDEAARCLDERLVRRAREIDLCMVMGLGFPPFRGGLLRWADSLTVPYVIERLEAIYNRHGSSRTASPYLKKLAEQNRGFYSRNTEDN